MTTDSHRGDNRGSKRDHNRRKDKEDAKENGIRQQLTDEEYEKELAEIREQFNKLKMMIEENQRYGWTMKKKVKWQRLQQKREQQVNMLLAEELRKLEQMMSVQLECAELREAKLKMEVSICEAEQSEVMGTDEEWRSVKDLMNYCEDLRQK